MFDFPTTNWKQLRHGFSVLVLFVLIGSIRGSEVSGQDGRKEVWQNHGQQNHFFWGEIRLRAAARGLLAISNILRLQPNTGFMEFDEALAVEVAEGLFEGFFACLKSGANFFGRAGVAVGEAALV